MRIAPKTLVCCAAVFALVGAGCGGSDDEPKPAKTPAAASTQTQTTGPAQAPEQSTRKTSPAVAPKQERLEKAGYDVIVSGTAGVDPPPEGALEFPLKGGGQITVFVYTKPVDAQAKAAEFEKLAKQYPGQGKVAVVGSTAYIGTAEDPEKLDVTGFDQAVAHAENK